MASGDVPDACSEGFDMVMQPLSLDKVKEICKGQRLKPGKVKDSKVPVILFIKKPSERVEEISWDEFDSVMQKYKLSVKGSYSKKKDTWFLKMMQK